MKSILSVFVFFFSSLHGAGYKLVLQEEDALNYPSKYVVQLEELYAGIKTVAIRTYDQASDSSLIGKVPLGYVVLDPQSAQDQEFSIFLPHVYEYENYIRIIGNRFGFVTKLDLEAKKITATPMTQALRKSLFRKMLERFFLIERVSLPRM